QQHHRHHHYHHHHDHHHHHQRQVLCELVCYGIGNFSENHSSRYQLALALCLRDLLFPATNRAAASPAATATRSSTSNTTTTITESGSCAAGAQKADTFERRGSWRSNSSQTEPTVAASSRGAAIAPGIASFKSPVSSSNNPSTTAGNQQREGAPPPPPSPPSPSPPSMLPPSRMQGVSTPRPEILVFDPVMGDAEKSILAALGCGTLENE
ncbi:unnamed protein product, partial [Laminaria digitata]